MDLNLANVSMTCVDTYVKACWHDKTGGELIRNWRLKDAENESAWRHADIPEPIFFLNR